jgi:hypothetical protein
VIRTCDGCLPLSPSCTHTSLVIAFLHISSVHVLRRNECPQEVIAFSTISCQLYPMPLLTSKCISMFKKISVPCTFPVGQTNGWNTPITPTEIFRNGLPDRRDLPPKFFCNVVFAEATCRAWGLTSFIEQIIPTWSIQTVEMEPLMNRYQMPRGNVCCRTLASRVSELCYAFVASCYFFPCRCLLHVSM